MGSSVASCRREIRVPQGKSANVALTDCCAMRNTLHFLEPNDITGRQLAAKLGVAPSKLNRVPQGNSGISHEMALRLSKALGRSPESWLAMQGSHDRWQAPQMVKLDAVGRVDSRAA